MVSAGPVTPLVDAEWVHARLQNAAIRIVQATWAESIGGREVFPVERIPRAGKYDIDSEADPHSDLVTRPHMLPSPSRFAASLRRLGIRKDDHVVIYDSDGLHGSPRLWWTFFVLGFTRVSVLDGGLPAWRKVFPCETGAPSECEPVAIDDPFAFQPALDVSLLCSLADVERVASGDESCPLVLFDARSPGRFYGRDPEPRPVPSGHVPNAISLPYSQCLDASRTRMADTDTLRKVLTRLESEERTAVFMCGSGFTAAICVFAAYLVGLKTPLLYDGSWMEWVHSGGVVVAE